MNLLSWSKISYIQGNILSHVWLTWGAGNVNPAWQRQGWDQRHRGFPGDEQGLKGHLSPGGGPPLPPDVLCWPREAPSQPGKETERENLSHCWWGPVTVMVVSAHGARLWAARRGKKKERIGLLMLLQPPFLPQALLSTVSHKPPPCKNTRIDISLWGVYGKIEKKAGREW